MPLVAGISRLLCVAVVFSAGCGGPTGDPGPAKDDPPPAVDDPRIGDDTGEPPLRILPLGDSITHGFTAVGSYRRPLWLMLEEAGARIDFVGTLREHHDGPPRHDDFDHDHEGHGGWTADELRDRLDPWPEELPVPDLVLLHVGTNDLGRGDEIDTAVDDIRALVDLLLAHDPGLRVLLAELIPTRIPAANERIRALNRRIRAFAAERERVTAVDHHTPMDPATHYHDHLHPNRAGNRRMAETWLPAIRAAGRAGRPADPRPR